MPVTSFRDYLASPYLYYLRHVLRLSEVTDAPSELDAGGFGDLIHSCLGAFGRSQVAGSTDAEVIERFLSAELDQTLLSKFGATPPAAILVQRANARARLRAFARWQATHVAEGWGIEHVEWSPSQRELAHGTSPPPTTPNADSSTPTSSGVPFDVDGQHVLLIGRIDRIDRHRDGRVLLLDYKTAKDAKSPEKVHQAGRSGERRWVDLQLPLYRRLAMSVAGPDAAMGYVCLPMRATDTSLRPASWGPDDLASAEECAREVIRRIRQRDFFSLGTSPPTEGVMGWLAGTGFVAAHDGETDEGSDT
jgi:ATP-dependent helicase/DNAse subunit B